MGNLGVSRWHARVTLDLDLVGPGSVVSVQRSEVSPTGTPGKKPPAPSVKRRSAQSFSIMVEILESRKPQQADDAETGLRSSEPPSAKSAAASSPQAPLP